ncbi:MAG TPA: sulfatase-like hydrolase/transferase [Terriglobales bacterium]
MHNVPETTIADTPPSRANRVDGLMRRPHGFRSVVVCLWFRLITLAMVGLVFALALYLGRVKVQYWTFYLSSWEVVFEVTVRLVFAAVAGIALGSLCTAIVAPFLWYFGSSRERLSQIVTSAAVVIVVFLDSRFALVSLGRWMRRGPRFFTAVVIAHFLFFVVALLARRSRKEVLTSLDVFLGEKATRGVALAVVIVLVALIGGEYLCGHSLRAVKAATSAPHPKNNILLITFDALSAEDMSLYGYKLPTTPNIDTFARNATVFTNYYSTSTFTTPTITTMLTGGYPSETRVFQLQGRIRGASAADTLPKVMRNAGYATGGFLTNPFAYYAVSGPENAFDVLPEPVFRAGGLQRAWAWTSPIHQNSGIGSRVAEYIDLESLWQWLTGAPDNIVLRYRPAATFEHAQQVLAQLPDGFFMWVHVITPHHPYLPDPADRGRFLPAAEGRTFEEDAGRRWVPHYPPDQQAQVDRRRLLYDEFVLTADRAFGTFIASLEKSGRLANTTVIVSADHGESFSGGVFQHENEYLTRPVIHVPLIIKQPGQLKGHTVAFTADQTALGPTILDLAGVQKPQWMRGQSLAGWLGSERSGTDEGIAFTQFFERNSVLRPLHHGMAAALDGQYEYVFDLDSQKGSLRPLKQAEIWNLDRTSDDPAHADAQRAALFSRFPELKCCGN